MPEQLPNVLFIVATGREHGIGHLKRCNVIAESGQKTFNSYFCVSDEIYNISEIRNFLSFPLINFKDLEESRLFDGNIDIIVTDYRDTSKKFMMELTKIAPVISIDDVGPGAKYAVSTILSLPTIKRIDANYKGLKYLVLDPSIDEIRRKIEKNSYQKKDGILISFGGSDPGSLGLEISKILSSSGYSLKIIKGPLNKINNRLYNDLNVEVVENPENIFDLIAHAELLITSFGITLFESLYLKTPVILYNYTKYHYKLSLNYDLPNLAYPGYFKKSDLKRHLIESIEDKERLLYGCEKYQNLVDTNGAKRIISIIKKTIDNGRKDCLFHHHSYKVIFRKEDYSISKCLKCNDLFLTRMRDKKGKYEKDYFLEEYEKQYGKSYENDRENIDKVGTIRLNRIERLKPDKGKLLDIGCALGFFVKLSSTRGWESTGIEISEYASNWARDVLGINVISGDFYTHDFSNEYFDAITMFYVLEHFYNVEDVIKKVYSVLKRNGVLAIALPNRSGINYRLNRKYFLKNHPDDHFFDTNPRNITKFLSLNGFIVKDIRITGIHPERFFSMFGLKKIPGFLDKLYSFFAEVLHLGDTFEIYAIKK